VWDLRIAAGKYIFCLFSLFAAAEVVLHRKQYEFPVSLYLFSLNRGKIYGM